LLDTGYLTKIVQFDEKLNTLLSMSQRFGIILYNRIISHFLLKRSYILLSIFDNIEFIIIMWYSDVYIEYFTFVL